MAGEFDADPSCGEVVLAHLRRLDEAHRRGVFPLPAGALNLPAVTADPDFRDGLFRGIISFSTRDADGISWHFAGGRSPSGEVLRLDFAAAGFPWRLLSTVEWVRELRTSERAWSAARYAARRRL